MKPESKSSGDVAAGSSEDRPLLSATIICQDEADKIRGALESVRFCDEVIVVDSGSTDGTVDICTELADRVIERDWPGYVAQQNYALSEARGDWVLSIDADERVTPELASQVRKVVAQDPPFDGYQVNRHIHYLGRWIDHSGWFPEYRVRLFRRGKGRWEGIDPHYDGVVDGPVGRLGGEVQHFTYDDMSDHVRTMNRFSSVSAREHQKRGRRFSWYHVLIRPPLEFLRVYLWQRGFLDGPQGFYVAIISAFSVFLKFAKLWEIQRAAGKQRWVDGNTK